MYKLNTMQVQSFYEKGWIGPLDTFSSEEMELINKQLKAVSQVKEIDGAEVRKFYNKYMDCYTPRDHHFSSEPLARLFADQRIVRRLNQLGVADLLLWRTYILDRLPGQLGLGWHQSIEYFGYDFDETKRRDLSFPKGEYLFNLTVWVAIEDVTSEMGTLKFANGSHRKRFEVIKVPADRGVFPGQKYSVYGGKNSPYSKSYNFNENEWEIETLPKIKAGQIVIFTERVMHSSPDNYSEQERLALNGRYIPTSVTVYPDRLAGDYTDNYGRDISNHFCALVSGEDNFDINVVKDWKHMSQT